MVWTAKSNMSVFHQRTHTEACTSKVNAALFQSLLHAGSFESSVLDHSFSSEFVTRPFKLYKMQWVCLHVPVCE